MSLRNPSFQQVMLRVKDPKVTVAWYERHFGLTVIDTKSFPEYSFDLVFMASLPTGATPPAPGTKEANKALWSMATTCLELTFNYGTDKDEAFRYNNGNVEPNRGFGHIGFIVDDIAAFCAKLEAGGVAFQKKLTDGRMRNIAFALDPDGYWVEILPRTADAALLATLPAQPPAWPTISGKPSLQQAMVRIRDPAVSLPWYERHMGLRVVSARHFPEAKFSVYFLATLPPGSPAPPSDPTSEEAWGYILASSGTFLELTHNHGTESDATFKGYHNGNTEPRGYGHIGLLTDDLEEACKDLETAGVTFTKRPHEGKMRGLAFCKDPDGYMIEIIQRGVDM